MISEWLLTKRKKFMSVKFFLAHSGNKIMMIVSDW